MVENFDTLGYPSYGAFVILGDLITLGTIKPYIVRFSYGMLPS